MTRNKRIFLFIALIFLLLLALVVWDFSRKTEFRRNKELPGQEQPNTVQQ